MNLYIYVIKDFDGSISIVGQICATYLEYLRSVHKLKRAHVRRAINHAQIYRANFCQKCYDHLYNHLYTLAGYKHFVFDVHLARRHLCERCQIKYNCATRQIQ